MKLTKSIIAGVWLAGAALGGCGGNDNDEEPMPPPEPFAFDEAAIEVVDNYNSPALFRLFWLSNYGGDTTVEPKQFKLQGRYADLAKTPVAFDIDKTMASFDFHIPIHLLTKAEIQNSEFTLSAVGENGETVDALPLKPESIEVEDKDLISYIPLPGNNSEIERSENFEFGAASNIAADASVVVITAPGFEEKLADDSEETPRKGAVYTYSRSNITMAWQPAAQTLVNEALELDLEQVGFGADLQLADDGKLLAVMDFNADQNKTGISVYKRREEGDDNETGYWKFIERVELDSERQWEMALSGNGTRLAVGEFSDSSEVVKVYAIDIAGEDPIGDPLELRAPDQGGNPAAADAVQPSLAFSDDGKILAVGSPYGAAYIFRDPGDGGSWAPVSLSETAEQFGTALALSGDGRVLAVGAAGSVYVYRDSSETPWSTDAGGIPPADVVSPDLAADEFGHAMQLSGDGNILAISAPGDSGNTTGVWSTQNTSDAEDSGAVFIYRYLSGAWTPGNYIKASNTAGGDGFGRSLALSKDGGVLMAGAPYRDLEVPENQAEPDGAKKTVANPGAVYLY